MNTFIISLVLVLCVFGLIYAGIFKTAATRNVIIYVFREDTLISMGSGVAIGKGFVLSVGHILANRPEDELQFMVLYGNKTARAFFLQVDSGKDGLLLLYLPESFKLPFVRIVPALPLEEVLLWGNCQFMLDVPIVANVVRTVDKTDMYVDFRGLAYDQLTLINTNITNGFSGCGVWTKNKELCGIVWGSIAFGELKLATVVTKQDIIKFLLKFTNAQKKN